MFYYLFLYRYFHRPLNFKKLVECGFCGVPKGSSIERMTEKYNLKKSIKSLDDIGSLYTGLALMSKEDVPGVFHLLNGYLAEFPFAPKFRDEEEISHWLLPRKDLLYSFVVKGKEGEIEGFVSFYSLPSQILFESTHSDIQTAYMFYCGFKGKDSAEERMVPLMKSLLIIAKFLGFDVLNCTDVGQNGLFLESLKFGPGDGRLRYYLYNWKSSPFEPKDIALLML